ncbi:MAG: hypothetical protein A7316_06000 [Candidatus Altiarchaeales archaeon WOR_SM1_86-2]|nr:MAG: hypothetical protein A7316_06000 [Candidatus Altiarchaeales archaeon WOR_SM1_86-2]ODS41757.1 MAG: hypothetical protein A7315_00350 [Candidatus Altiarchaeales archaeon WOR_SM1_79]
MHEIVVSSKIPTDLGKWLDQFTKDEYTDRSAAIRKLLSIGLEKWRKEKALRKLERGEITFMGACELSGLDVWDFAELVENSGITWIKSKEDIKRDIRDALTK